MTARAQQNTAEIVGTVTDSSGAVVPTVQVVIENMGTGVHRSIQTQDGSYAFTLLQIGKYAVHVSAAGFKTSDVPAFDLDAGERRRIDVTLQVGAQSESVQVSANVEAQLETDNSTITQTISEQNIQNLPMNGLNYVVLAQDLTAGANQGLPGQINSGQRPDDRRVTSEISANGQFPSANNNLIDGMDNNERIIGGLGVRPSTEALEDLRVETSIYSADISRAAGAVINMITKAGTNKFHGSAYEYIRNDDLDARNYFALTQPELRQNQFGGSVGGPILKSKAFFFFDYEGLRVVNGVTSEVQVPTAYEVASLKTSNGSSVDLTDLGGNVISTTGSAADGTLLNSIAAAYFALYPTCNVCDPASTNNFYSYSPRRTQNANTIDSRADYHFNESNSTFAHYTYNRTITSTPGELPPVNGISPGGEMWDFAGASNEYQHNIQLNYVHIFTPRLLSEVKVGWTRIQNLSLPLNWGVAASTKLGLLGANDTATDSGLTPMQIGNYATLGDEAYVPIEDIDDTGQLNATVTYTRGNQTIKVGTTEIRRLFENVQSAFGIGSYSFNGTGITSLTNFLTGSVGSFTRQNQVYPMQNRGWESGQFFQDDWRIAKKLTLNLGARWDVFTPYTERHNRMSNFVLAAGELEVASTTGVSPTANVNTIYSNFAPRLGFSYQVFPHTVIRGGFGITYLTMGWGTPVAMENQPFTFNATTSNVQLTSPMVTPVPTTAANPAGGVTGNVDTKFRPTATSQWSLGVEQAFGPNTVELRYVGSTGRHGYMPNVNADTPMPNPDLTAYAANGGYALPSQLPLYGPDPQTDLITATGGVVISYSEGVQNFNSLQAKFSRQLTHGLSMSTNFTWERDISDTDVEGGADDFEVPSMIRKIDYGTDENEIRARIGGGLTYYLPFGQSAHGIERAAIGGWQLNALGRWATGGVFSIEDSATILDPISGNSVPAINNGVNTSYRPNWVSGVNPFKNIPAGRFFNAAAFQTQPVGTIGNVEKNTMRGPHLRSLDLSASKDFKLTEQVTLRFRAEAFNITNTPTFANPSGDINSSSVGLITSTLSNTNPRQIQGSLKFVF
jgi:hypothetical protein